MKANEEGGDDGGQEDQFDAPLAPTEGENGNSSAAAAYRRLSSFTSFEHHDQDRSREEINLEDKVTEEKARGDDGDDRRIPSSSLSSTSLLVEGEAGGGSREQKGDGTASPGDTTKRDKPIRRRNKSTSYPIERDSCREEDALPQTLRDPANSMSPSHETLIIRVSPSFPPDEEQEDVTEKAEEEIANHHAVELRRFAV